MESKTDTSLGAYRMRVFRMNTKNHRPQKGTYRIVGYGTVSKHMVGVGYLFDIQVRKTALWGLVGWWKKVETHGHLDPAISRMRTLVADRERAEHCISKPKVLVTEDSLYETTKRQSSQSSYPIPGADAEQEKPCDETSS